MVGILTDEQRRILINNIEVSLTRALNYGDDKVHIHFDIDRDMYGFEGVLIFNPIDNDGTLNFFCEMCGLTTLNTIYVYIINRFKKAGLLDEEYTPRCCTCNMFINLLKNEKYEIFITYLVNMYGQLRDTVWHDMVENMSNCEEFSIIKDLDFNKKIKKKLSDYVARGNRVVR